MTILENMATIEASVLSWKFEDVQAELGTKATGEEFLKVWEATPEEKKAEIINRLEAKLSALYEEKKVPAVILYNAISAEEQHLNRKIAKALGKEGDGFYHSYIRFSVDTVGNKPVSLRVNWSSIGATEWKAARVFAQALDEACCYAAAFTFNGYEIIYK